MRLRCHPLYCLGGLVAAWVVGVPLAHAVPLDPLAFPSLGTLNSVMDAGVVDRVVFNTGGDGGVSIPIVTVFYQGGASTSEQGAIHTQPGNTGTQDFIPQIAVYAYDGIDLSSQVQVTVTGTRALALLSRGDAAIASNINVSGVNGGNTGLPGAGGPAGGMAGGSGDGGFGTGPGGGGGPPMGINHDGGGGGFGGPGGKGLVPGAGGEAYGDLTQKLQGGSGGGGGRTNAGGGGGGGAVEVGAVGHLALSGQITTKGGSGGDNLLDAGGGSGGALFIHAQTVSLSGALSAQGGPGGGTRGGGGAGGRVAVIGDMNINHTLGTPLAGLSINTAGGTSGSLDAQPGLAGTVTVTPTLTTVPPGRSVTLDGTPIISVPGQSSRTDPRIEAVIRHSLVIQDNAQVTLGGSDQLDANAHVTIDEDGLLSLAGFQQTVSGLSGDGGVAHLGSGTLTVDRDTDDGSFFAGQITGSGSLVKAGSGVLDLRGVNAYSGGTTVLQGTLTGPSGSLQGTIVNHGELVFSQEADGLTNAKVTGTGGVTKTGAGRLIIGGALSHTGDTTVSAGILELPKGMGAAGLPVTVAAAAELRAGGVVNRPITGNGVITATDALVIGDITDPNGVAFDGTLNVGSNLVILLDDDLAELGVNTNLATNGRLDTGNGARLTATDAITTTGPATVLGDMVNNGLIHGPTAPDEFLVFTSNVNGVGSYTGNIEFRGRFSPGLSPGQAGFEGSLTLGHTATLTVELGGVLPGLEHDRLTGGSLAAGGVLEVRLINGFEPRPGDTFDLFHFTNISGGFTRVDLPLLGGGMAWDASSLLTTGAIQAVPEPGALGVVLAGIVWWSVLARRHAASGDSPFLIMHAKEL